MQYFKDRDARRHLSEKRDSNPRPRPWQGRALPTELFSRIGSVAVGADGFEPPKAEPADLQSAPFGHSGIRPLALQDGLEPTTP